MREDRDYSPKSNYLLSSSFILKIGINQRCLIMKKNLTQERLKEFLHYDPETGKFKWIVRRKGVIPNKDAGCLKKDGYIHIGICGEKYLASRLAWLYTHGYFPENEIDHIDRNTTNDSLENLREVSHSCNMKNKGTQKNNKSGVSGVRWFEQTSRWVVRINSNKVQYNIGYFISKDDAVKARWEAEKKYGFPNCNTTSSAYNYLKEKDVA